MKKVVYLLLIILCIFFISCDKKEENKPTQNDESSVPSIKSETEVVDYDLLITKALDKIDIEKVIDSDITLPTSLKLDELDLVIDLIWQGSAHLSSTGVVTKDYSNHLETIKVMANYEGIRKVKEFEVLIKGISIEEVFDEYFESIEVADVIKEDLNYFLDLDFDGLVVSYSVDSNSISSDGKFIPAEIEENKVTDIKISVQYNDFNKEYVIKDATVASMAYLCEKALEKIDIPNTISDNINLPKSDGFVTIEWKSSNPRLLTNDGILNYTSVNTNVKLAGCFYIENEYGDYFLDHNFFTTATRWDFERRVNLVIDAIYVPKETKFDIYLINDLDYDVSCKWISSDESLLTNYGHVINDKENDVNVTLTLVLYDEDSKEEKRYEYDILIYHLEESEMEATFYNHNLVDRVESFVSSNLSGIVIENGKAKLASGALIGTYDSKVFSTLEFRRVVGSFSCITTPDATCELAISIRVNNTWSKYFSYGEFGLGRNNLYYDQTDTLSYMDTDMIEPNSGLHGDGVKYRITLRRKDASTDSPVLSLVALTLFLNNYSYAVDSSNLPDFVDWDVPRLYQNDVPNIGNVICSATTTCMLLKFAGFDFSDKGYVYEHEYMANMVADRGHNNPTYGNWSYNMMAASAFGVNAYVGKFYSWDEMRYHLANIGPIGCSISGNFGLYTTAGHLIVIRGYKIENGNTTVICNDPNVKGTYYEVTLDMFLRCWGSVVYIIEYDKLNN